ncbi:uncharacterized protein LOC130664006 isoform X2 [Microplitis mediator]|uniref:uncharacterized protein LOC130664006 isoform X2 n=1 Tax=Microplitis mediator TaxID=375433 RepID=UPI00255377E9|nr:uncharacterized protein LOC130664006 isoform X2 [Microplitis mediator]
MSFNQLPTEIKRKIFSNLERKERQTLRHVNSNWKAIIADMTKWKDRCSTNEIKPWKNQLIKLQYPSLKSDKYKHLKEKELKLIFLLYKKWRKVFTAAQFGFDTFKVTLENFPPRGLRFSYDLLADRFAVGTNSIGLIRLYDINEQMDMTHQFYFNDYADSNIVLDRREIESFRLLNSAIQMTLWMTGIGTVINVVYFRNQMLFWDVNRKIKIPTPPIFLIPRYRKSLHLRRGTDEYFYIINTSDETMNIIRLDYVENEITTTEILILHYTEDDSYEFIDFYAEGRKIMIVHKSHELENSLLTTIVKLPRSQILPVNIHASDKYTAASQMTEEILEYYDFFIPCMNIVIAYATENSELIIFKLKNLQHLKYLKFDKSLETKIIDTEELNTKFKITKCNDQIIILLEIFLPEVKLIICDLNL